MSNDGIPTLNYYSSVEKLMNGAERKKAVTALKSLMVKLRDIPGTYAKFSEIQEPLPEDLSLILKFLAETCKQLTGLDNKKFESSEAVMTVKQLCAAARIVRQILHVQQNSDYRALGLNDEATQEQIHKHYRWLSSLFAFDEAIDPERHSTRRTMQAYMTLKSLDVSREGDSDLLASASVLKDPQQQDSLNSGSFLDANEQLAASGSVADVNGKTVALVSVPEVKEKKRVKMRVAASVLFFLTVASGVGWWWLLSNHNVEKIATTEGIKENIPLKDESQNIGLTMLDEDLSNEFASTEEEKPDLQRKTKVETPLAVQLPFLSTQLDEEISIPELDMMEPSVPVVIAEGPDEDINENLLFIADVSKKTNETIAVKKETIKITKVEPITMSATEAAINDASEKQDTIQLEEHMQTDDLVRQENGVDGAANDVVNRENNSIQILSDTPIPVAAFKVPSSPTAAESTVEQPAQLTMMDNSTSQRFEKSLEGAMIVIGSQSLEVNSLSVEQVKNIFLGTRLPSGQQIEVFDQQEGSTIKGDFYEMVTGKTPRQIKAHWSKLQFTGLVHPPEILKNDRTIRDRVAAAKFAIGYINGGSLDKSVKILHILKSEQE